MTPCTTFARGINPFQCLGALPSTNPKSAMQKPAKPTRKYTKRIKDEDYSTPYKPPMADPVAAPAVSQNAAPVAKMRYVDTANLIICDDPLPLGRSIVEGKYDNKFKAMKIGQAVKCPPAAVGMIQGAMRKFIKVRGMKGVVVRTCKDYGDGLGRVWMLAEPSKYLGAAA